jgi:hypothetical protein
MLILGFGISGFTTSPFSGVFHRVFGIFGFVNSSG